MKKGGITLAPWKSTAKPLRCNNDGLPQPMFNEMEFILQTISKK
jgi:hypothetical protein